MITKVKNIFKKKKEIKYKLFGRERDDDNRSVCDVCGKEVGFHDYVYLCESCFNKLPQYAKDNHHWLIEYKDARSLYLKKAIGQLAK